jgi:hypothetical protein
MRLRFARMGLGFRPCVFCWGKVKSLRSWSLVGTLSRDSRGVSWKSEWMLEIGC